jgi:8-oxo-dGTP diphosphatase
VERQVVVGAAIVRGGRVLAARRTAPASAAGRWEFPGGKVEPGESDAESLVREVEEELGVLITVTQWLRGAERIDERYLLRVAVATLDSGEPAPTEHDQVRWLAAGELDDVDWLDGDRPFLTELSQVLPRLDE